MNTKKRFLEQVFVRYKEKTMKDLFSVRFPELLVLKSSTDIFYGRYLEVWFKGSLIYSKLLWKISK